MVTPGCGGVVVGGGLVKDTIQVVSPVGKAPAGAPPKLIACEKCTMHTLVDMSKIPTVTLEAYLGGSKPKTANLNSPKYRKLLAEVA